jgi:hypothetical protein
MTTGTTRDHDNPADVAVLPQDGDPRIRASDADRAETIEALQDATARGLLAHDESGERMGVAFAARFRDELPALTADLPPTGSPTIAATPGWRHLGSTLAGQVRHDAHAALAAGPRSRRFLLTVLVAILLLGFLVTLGALAVDGLFGGGFEGHAGFDGH